MLGGTRFVYASAVRLGLINFVGSMSASKAVLALVGANLTLTGQLFGSETELGDPVIAEEESLGTYVARFTWPTSGLWALLIDVGAAEASEQALVGVQVASQ